MLKELTYKKKNILLLAVFVLFLFIIYFLAINKTLDLYFQCNEMQAQLNQTQNASQQLSRLEMQMKEIEAVFGEEQEESYNYQQLLLEVLSNYCSGNNIVLRKFPEPIIIYEQEFSVETNIISVEGPFKNLLHLIYLLEQKNKLGKIASLHFQTREDFKTKQKALFADIYIQNAKKTNHEH